MERAIWAGAERVGGLRGSGVLWGGLGVLQVVHTCRRVLRVNSQLGIVSDRSKLNFQKQKKTKRIRHMPRQFAGCHDVALTPAA